MADFAKFTSGFVVSGVNIGIEAAKITRATEGIVTAFSDDKTMSIPTVGAVETWVTNNLTGENPIKVTSATSADNALTLDGHSAGEFAFDSELQEVSDAVTANTQDITTLKGYFDGTSALKAVNATQADTAGTATSAGEAAKLTNKIDLKATGDAIVEIKQIDGSQSVTSGTVQITDVPFSALPTTDATDMTATDKVLAADQVKAFVDSKLTAVYKVKGTATCAQIEALTPAQKEIGDVYNVSNGGTIDGMPVNAGDNVVWTEDGWDKLAGTIDVTGKLDTSVFNTWSGTTFEGVSAKYALDAEKLGGIAAESIIASAEAGAIAYDWFDTTGAGHITDTTIHVTSEDKAAWNAATESVNDLTGRMDTAEAAITAIQEDIETIDSDIEELSADVTANTSDITGLKTVSASLDTRLKTVEDTVDDLDADVTQAKTDISNLKTTVGDSTTGLVKDVADNTSAIEALDDRVDNLAYYSKITIGDKTAIANGPSAEFSFIAGNNVAIEPVTASTDPNPKIKISVSGVNFNIVGENGITATSGATGYTIAGVDATTAAAGVVKADYYEESTGLIHLF